MWSTRLVVALLAGFCAAGRHGRERRQAPGFTPLTGYPTQQQHHHHANGYGGGPGSLYPPAGYPQPVYPGAGHQAGAYLPPVPHTSVHIEPEKIVLNCVVQGYSSTPIQWLKPDGPGLVAEGGAVLWDRRHLLVETAVFGGGRRSRLVLSYPRPRHLGLYLCRAGGAASRAFRVGGGGSGGFQPVYHGRSGGSGQIRAPEPGQEPEPEPETEHGQEPELGADSPPLTEHQRQQIRDTIQHEIQEVEDAIEGMENAKGL